MVLEPIITFRGLQRSDAIESYIRGRLRRLEAFCPTIVGCRVLVELGERRHEAGNRYRVRIDLSVPGEDIVVAHEPSLRATQRAIAQPRTRKADEPDPERKHALVAVREAFDHARRRLQDYVRRRRGLVKAPAQQPRGRVARLFPADRYGYIEADDGHEVYFQAESVLNKAFDRLTVGSLVSFVEEPGEKGPKASTVRLLHPRRVRRARRTGVETGEPLELHGGHHG